MAGMRPKETRCERVTRSEMAWAYTGGAKEHLQLQAELAINRLLSALGPNAKGEFHIGVSFRPDYRAKG